MATDDIPRPKRYLIIYSKTYPNIWRDIDALRANRGKDGVPWWPDWCFVPISVIYPVIAKIHPNKDQINVHAFKEMYDDISTLAIMAAWRVTQGIYRFDRDIYEDVINTSIAGKIPVDVLKNIPEWAVYIETPGLVFFDNSLAGFFAALNYDIDSQREEILLVFDCIDGEKVLMPMINSIHLGYDTLEESIRETIRESTEYWEEQWQHDTGMNNEEFIQNAIAEFETIISLLLYLCSVNGEIEPVDKRLPSKPEPKKTKRGPRLFPPDKPTTWNVGVRMGAAIRRAKTMTTADDRGGTHASPRPHVRRAHWHTFWTGPREDPQKRKPILKWLSPILVGGDSKDMPVTIRRVKK